MLKSHLALERNLNLHRLDARNPAQLPDLRIQEGGEFPALLIQFRDLMIRVAGTPERRHELLLDIRHGSVVEGKRQEMSAEPHRTQSAIRLGIVGRLVPICLRLRLGYSLL